MHGDPADLVTLDPADLVAELVGRPAWMADAACAEHPDLPWVPARGESTAPAKRVCAGCLVREECLAWALERHAQGDELHGVWGGTSNQERRRMPAAQAPLPGDPEHGTEKRYRAGCRCDDCRAAKSAANRRQKARRRRTAA